jgi:hypothetical protein
LRPVVTMLVTASAWPSRIIAFNNSLLTPLASNTEYGCPRGSAFSQHSENATSLVAHRPHSNHFRCPPNACTPAGAFAPCYRTYCSTPIRPPYGRPIPHRHQSHRALARSRTAGPPPGTREPHRAATRRMALTKPKRRCGLAANQHARLSQKMWTRNRFLA